MTEHALTRREFNGTLGGLIVAFSMGLAAVLTHMQSKSGKN